MAIHSRIAYRLERRLRGDRRTDDRGIGRRRTDFEPNLGWKPAAAIALSIALMDWYVKWWVAQRVPLDTMEVIVPGRIALWHVQNHAMILGLYGDLPISARATIAVASGVVGAILLFEIVSRGHRLQPARRKWAWLFVGLALGGMLGNLGERTIHWWVTDYLSLAWGDIWLPPGNVADLAIFLSLPVALVVVGFELAARTQRSAAPPTEGVSAEAPAVEA